MKKLSRNEVTYLAFAAVVVVIGLKLSSVGVGAGNLLQNDGYNVTGALIACVGGFMLGCIFMKKKK